MRSMIFTLAVLFILVASPAHAQSWIFAERGGGNGNDYGDRVAVDAEGNSYVTGVLSGPATLDTIALPMPWRWGLYLAKYNSLGRVVWATLVAHTEDQTSDLFASAIALDRWGDIYIGGRFLTDVTFAGVRRSSRGSSDMYLAKLNNDGSLLWVRTPGGVGLGSFGQDGITSIGLDSAGNCYVTGHYNTDARFDTIDLTSNLTIEAFVAKYDSSGAVIWARSAEGAGAMHLGLGIAVEPSGSCYITGRFFNTLTLGSYTFDAGDPEQKIFIAKIDPNGSFLWARKVGSGGYYGAGEDVAVDPAGDVYVVGQFRATIEFGDTMHTYNQTRYAVLAVKYSGDGDYIWSARSRGDDQAAGVTDVGIDGDGNVFITGGFRGTIEFGSTRLTGHADHGSAFIAQLTPQGAFAAASRIGGVSSVSGGGIALMSDGDCVIVGTFTDSMTIGSESLRSAGGLDMFLARLSRRGSGVDWAGDAGAPGLLLYPNPAFDMVRLKGDGARGPIRIIAIDGSLRMECGYADRIDLGGLPPGVYLVWAGGRVGRLVKLSSE